MMPKKEEKIHPQYQFYLLSRNEFNSPCLFVVCIEFFENINKYRVLCKAGRYVTRLLPTTTMMK